MFFDFSKYSYVLRPGVTDMRCGEGSLAGMVQSQMGMDPLVRTMFLFCNKRRTIITVLAWDGSGFWLMRKKLHGSTFRWPGSVSECMSVGLDDVRRLLQGQDVFRKIGLIDGKKWM